MSTGSKAFLPAQIGMHHVALDRTGPHDRHFDHQIVEFLGPQPRQHRHLRAAFHLEDADGVGARQHVVDRGLVLGDVRKLYRFPVMLRDQIEPPAQARQHAKAEHVDLEDVQSVEVVLVPFDHRPLFHGGVLDRNDFVELRFRNDKAADVLGKMPRELHAAPWPARASG